VVCNLADYFDTLVITSGTKWEEPPRIRHQIAFEMKKYFKRVLFVESPRQLRYDFEEDAFIELGVRQVDDNIFALRLPKLFVLPKNGHSLIPFLSETLQKNNINKIHNSLVNIGAKNPILINFTYSNHVFHDPNLFPFSVFVLNDDFINKAPNPLIYHLAKRMQDKTARKADMCLAVSTPLLEQVKRVNSDSHLFLPGHNFGEMTIGSSNCYPRQGNRKIRVAFMGYIDGRLDLDWIKHASSQEKIDFYLVGPNCLDKEDTKELQAQGVIFKQALKGEELFKFLASCDVLTMPYVLNTTTIAATAPNKMFQYIASGRPIVSSNMPYLLELPDGVLQKANDEEDFVQKINEAVAMDSEEHVKERFKVASENTWGKRGLELMNIIGKGIKGKHG